MTTLGLKIDVDTFRGTRIGVPNLCRLLSRYGISASFFFSVGPDNMGRNLWRLLRPDFLKKMLRSGAPSLYGWDILLMGTAWPGPKIGKRLGDTIAQAAAQKHEIGLHAWDHYTWQMKIDKMNTENISDHLQKGVDMLTEITGKAPVSSAAPSWKCTRDVLAARDRFPFAYNSDCRGESIFVPEIGGRTFSQPQIPTTLPTYDEVIGRNGVTDSNYNAFILSRIRPGRLNVLTAHAEAEGSAKIDLFEHFLQYALEKKIDILPLGRLLDQALQPIPVSAVVNSEIPGRDGWISFQDSES